MQLCAVVVVVGVALLAAPALAIPQFFGNQHGGFGGGHHGGGFGGGHHQGGGFGGGHHQGGGIGINIPGLAPLVGAVSPVVVPINNHGAVNPPARCVNWCKTPEGAVYCCKDKNEPQGNVNVVKQGRCPAVRPNCSTRTFLPPANCSSDGDCTGSDRCCFDRCLERHVCKPIQNFGFGFGFGGR